MAADPPLRFVTVGANPARPFGLDAADRACRLAANAGFTCAEAADGEAALLASLDYAWDPAWLKALRSRPGSVLTLGGKPVMAHIAADGDFAAAMRALERGEALPGLDPMPAETTELNYAELRKRERPFVLALDPANPEPVERAAYDAAYKGVTDILTL
jgi:hypothetical protein